MKIIYSIFLFFLLVLVDKISGDCAISVLDIVIVLDESGSIGPIEYLKAKNATHKLVSNLNVNPNKIHVGLVRYSDKVVTARSLVDKDQNKNELLAFINAMVYMGGSTATGDALNAADTLFTKLGRSHTPRVALVFTDGGSNTGSSVYVASDNIKRDKVHVFAIGIGSGINDKELTYIASDPKSTYKKVVSDYNALVSAINAITNIACDTNAIVEIGEKAVIKTGKNEIRKFESDVSKLVNLKAGFLEFALSNKKGYTELAYSFTDPNPSVFSQVSTREAINEFGAKTLYFDIPIPANPKFFYFKLKSLGDGENEYEFVLDKW